MTREAQATETLVRRVTSDVRAFYEACPFPNYDGFESVADLVARAQRGTFAGLLNDQIPFLTRIVDVGCGTGQLPIYLSLATRQVVGFDLSGPSLRLGRDFAARHGLRRVSFVQGDLFRPGLLRESFDVVLANGVLHHTADPRRALAAIAELARPGGYLVVGLYNRYARLPLRLRRSVMRLVPGRWWRLDPVLQQRRSRRALSWFRDQYRHPCEVSVSVDTALGWFADCGLRFVSCLPPLDGPPAAAAQLFVPSGHGTRPGRIWRQLSWAWTHGHEGGLFVLVGRKEPCDVSVAA